MIYSTFMVVYYCS